MGTLEWARFSEAQPHVRELTPIFPNRAMTLADEMAAADAKAPVSAEQMGLVGPPPSPELSPVR